MTTAWHKDKIIEVFRSGKKPIALRYPDGKYVDLNSSGLAHMEGEYQVEEKPYEIIVYWRALKR